MPISTKIEKLVTYSQFRLKSFCRAPENEKSVFIHISSINPNRRLLQIVSQFLYCGYSCYLDIPFKQYIHSDISGRIAALSKNVYPAKKNKKYDIIVSDKQEIFKYFNNNELKMFFNLKIFDTLKNTDKIGKYDLFYPITKYYKYIAPSLEKEIYQKALLNRKRKIAALFIGNVDADNNNELTKILFAVNTRQETFSAVASISSSILYTPESLDKFLKDIESGILINKVVLLNIYKSFNIPDNYWFDILLETNFFIYMCGYIQPYCHNQIESMGAGCIPVTQFNRFFIPHFEHKKNALLFDTLEELKIELEKIVSGIYNETEMRENILKYFQENYSFSSFENKLSYIITNNIRETTYHIATGEEHIILNRKENAI